MSLKLVQFYQKMAASGKKETVFTFLILDLTLAFVCHKLHMFSLDMSMLEVYLVKLFYNSDFNHPFLMGLCCMIFHDKQLNNESCLAYCVYSENSQIKAVYKCLQTTATSQTVCIHHCYVSCMVYTKC